MIIKWFFDQSVANIFLFSCFVLVNLVAFFAVALDKSKSMSDTRRIRERSLWLFALFGGSPGLLLGMHLFRHKTKKLSFQVVVAGIVIVQILIVLFVKNYFFK